MPNLNIIGNGFDLYHGLPTSYYYSDSDKITIGKTAEFLGLEEAQYEMFELRNESSKKIESEIVKESHIQTFPML